MQMLCIVILPLLVMISRPRQGLVIVGAMAAASAAYAGAIMVVYDTSPAVLVLPLYMAQVRNGSVIVPNRPGHLIPVIRGTEVDFLNGCSELSLGRSPLRQLSLFSPLRPGRLKYTYM